MVAKGERISLFGIPFELFCISGKLFCFKSAVKKRRFDEIDEIF